MAKKALVYIALNRTQIFSVNKKVEHCVQDLKNAKVYPSEATILECLGGKTIKEFSLEPFLERQKVSEEDARKFILERQKEIDRVQKQHPNLKHQTLYGILRCDPNDPIEKQIQDYIKSAEIVWK